mmetsp:Transcript_8237/g.25704  ORF Transcript_8237/g.25704 Transcript_8237/m.25704 type:complete len:226 (-) Transcript_8237:64-741(-)
MGKTASKMVFGAPAPPSHFDVLDKAEKLRSEGAHDAALESYTEAIEMFPTYYFSWLRRATLLTEMGRYDAAIDDLAECERLRPTDPDVYLARAAVFEAQDEFEEAAKERARMPPEAKEILQRQKQQAADRRAAAEDAAGNETYDEKYGEHEEKFRAAMQKDYNRQRMVSGRRGHYIQSDADRKVVERRMQFKRDVAALNAAATTRGNYTALGGGSAARAKKTTDV